MQHVFLSTASNLCGMRRFCSTNLTPADQEMTGFPSS